MKTFKEYLAEASDPRGGLHVFDIDDTLFKTNAKIRVKKKSTGEHVATLSNSQFNTHKLGDDEHYDFSEFRDAQKFDDESKPMHNMLGKLRKIHSNVKKSKNSKVIMNTARADFDNKNKFLDAFRKRKVDIDDIHVHRSGNDTSNKSVGEKKNDVVRKYLKSGNFRHVSLYDDSEHNLKAFLKLKDEHPDVNFKAFHVQHNGSTKRYR